MAEGEKALLAKAIAGDCDALSELLSAHGPAVEAQLRIDNVWQGALDAADVMQVTYLEAFLRIRTFDINGSASFATWLRHVAENNLRDAIRGLSRKKRPQPKQRVTAPNHEESMEGLFVLLCATTTTPSRQVGRKEICSLLDQAIDALPRDYAQVIRHYDLKNKPIAEIAEAMGRSSGAVHMLRARAHDRLREALGSASQFFGSRDS